jgi:hypothetical protein
MKLVTLLFLSFALFAHAKLSADLKCSICDNIFLELEKNLAGEVQGKKIDLRGRLDSKGQRQGKIVDYKMSESRIEELLNPVCEKFGEYSQWTRRFSDIKEVKPPGFNDVTNDFDYDMLPKDKRDYMNNAVGNFCDMFIEEYEDDLATSIRKEVTTEEMTKKHCKKYCKQTVVKRAKWEKTIVVKKAELKKKKEEEEAEEEAEKQKEKEEEEAQKQEEKIQKNQDILRRHANMKRDKLLDEGGTPHSQLSDGTLVYGDENDVEVTKIDGKISQLSIKGDSFIATKDLRINCKQASYKTTGDTSVKGGKEEL